MSDWLMDTFGMDAGFARGMQFVIALLVVFALFALMVFALRRLNGIGAKGGGRNRQPRLAVMDQTPVDTRRRLVLIRRDNVEHLLLIGGPSDVVVEQAITRGHAVGMQPRATYGVQPAAMQEPVIGAATSGAVAVGAAAATAAFSPTGAEAAEESASADAGQAAPEPVTPVAPIVEPVPPAPHGDADDTLSALGREPIRERPRRERMRGERKEVDAGKRRIGEGGLLRRHRDKPSTGEKIEPAADAPEPQPLPDPTPDPVSEPVSEPVPSPTTRHEPAIRREPVQPNATDEAPDKTAAPFGHTPKRTSARESSDQSRSRAFGRTTRGPAAGLFEHERHKEGGEKRSLSSIVAAASGASAAMLGKTGKAGEKDAEAHTADEAATPKIETPVPAPPVSAPESSEASVAGMPPIEMPTPEPLEPDAPTVTTPPIETPKPDAPASEGSLADVRPDGGATGKEAPEPAKVGSSEPAWLRDLQTGRENDLTAPTPAKRGARVEPSFVSRSAKDEDAAVEAPKTDNAPAGDDTVSVGPTTPERDYGDIGRGLEAALGDLGAPDEPAAEAGNAGAADENSDGKPGEKSGDSADRASAPTSQDGNASADEPSGAAPEIVVSPEDGEASPSDEIEQEMAKLLNELTGKRD